MADMQPNTKRFFDQALPSGEGGHALMLREQHDQMGHIPFLTKALPELKGLHNLGAIATEAPPFMMLFDWAYRDGRLGDTSEANRAALRDAYMLYTKDAFDENMRAKANLHADAIDAGIVTVHFDSRHTLPHTVAQIAHAQNPDAAYAEAIARAELLYDTYPEYAQSLDTIEAVIYNLKLGGAPEDTISAAIVDLLADKNTNIITLSGEGHLAGTYIAPLRAQGIFDEGVAINGWHVTDAIIGDSADIQKILGNGFSRDLCDNYDHLDVLVNVETDEIKKSSYLLALGESFFKKGVSELKDEGVFSCVDSHLPEKMFTPEELDPSLIPELSEALIKARETLSSDANISGHFHVTALQTGSPEKER